MARYAEIFVQHVAGKDVGLDQFLDRIAVFLDAMLDLRQRAVLQIQVQWRHAALDVQMPDHEVIAFVFDHRRDFFC